MRYLAFLLLVALPVSVHAQVPDAAQPLPTDTLSFYGMQMYVSVVSGQTGLNLQRENVTGSALKDAGYSKHGEFYLRQWSDPITDDTLFRLISFSEDPASVGMEGTNLDGSGILRLYCNRSRTVKMSVIADGSVYGGSDGTIGGTVRFDDDPPHKSGNWAAPTTANVAYAPDKLVKKYWLSLAAKDTLAVRLDSDAGGEFTYLFALDGFTDAAAKTARCLGS